MKKILISTTLIAFSMLFIVFFAWDSSLFWDDSFKKEYKLAKQGDSLWQYSVGDTFLSGKFGVRKNKKKAIYWLTKAAQQGEPDIQYFVGQRYGQELSNSVKAIYWLSKAARAGNIDAQRVLGNDYASEYGYVKKDLARAIYWLTKAAEQGAYLEQYKLGKIYYDGEEEYKNDKKALDWLTKAALNGHSRAQYLLGNMYYDGTATKRSRSRAAVWWRNAAEQGNYYAQSNLGMLYYDGIGVIQSYKSAYIWCGLAATYPVSDSRFSEKRKLAKKYRDLSIEKLSRLQIVEAQEFMSTTQDEYNAR